MRHLPTIDEIVPGLYKISLKLPISQLQNVFVYLFRDGNENLLVDTGWNNESTYDELRKAFDSINFEMSEIKTIVISHLHPDHFGLASRLKTGARNSRLLLHQNDAQNALYTPEAYSIFIEKMKSFLRANGTPDDAIEEMMSAGRSFERQFSGLSKPDVLLNGGERLVAGRWTLEVISTPGHTRGNICLYDCKSNILFSGDHVLPKITPNISLSPFYEGDPLGDYLRALNGLKKLEPMKILPSHEYVFDNLARRIEEIEGHHKQRLSEVMDVLGRSSAGATGYYVAKELNWSVSGFLKLSPWQKSAAITETLAHLEYLKRNGKVLELLERAVESEVISYSKMVS